MYFPMKQHVQTTKILFATFRHCAGDQGTRITALRVPEDDSLLAVAPIPIAASAVVDDLLIGNVNKRRAIW